MLTDARIKRRSGYKMVQAKNLPDDLMVRAVAGLVAARGRGCAMLWDIQAMWSPIPPKVVLAKLRSMVRRRVISAQCTCGCRGDFHPDPDHWYPRCCSDDNSPVP